MADIVREIRPGGGGDYDSLAAWNTGEATDLVADGDTHRCDVYSGGNAGTVQLSTAWNSSATNTLTITSPDGERHEGVYDTNKAFVETATGDGINLDSVPWVDLNNIQVCATGTAEFRSAIRKVNTGTEAYVHSCIVKGPGGDVRGVTGIITSANLGNPTMFAWNNVIFDFTSPSNVFTAGIRTQGADDATFYNNTIVNCRWAVRADTGTPLIKNNVFQSAPTTGTFDSNSSHTLTTSSSAPGSNNIVSTTLTFVDAANDNYQLAAVDTAAIDAGLDLSADPTLSFGIDAIGTSRPQGTAWDIGAFERLAGGTVYQVNASDGTSASDAPGGNLVLLGDVSDGTSSADSTGGNMTLLAAAQEVVNASDSCNAVMIIPAGAADGMTASEFVTTGSVFLVDTADGTTTSDNSGIGMLLNISAGEQVIASDSGEPVVLLTANAADGVTLSDGTTSTGIFIAQAADGVSVSDIASILGGDLPVQMFVAVTSRTGAIQFRIVGD